MTTATVQAVPHGDHRCYWRGCRRPECCSAAAARNKRSSYLRQTGRGTICPPDRAARHIQQLRAGMEDAQIKAAAKLGDETFYRILNGRSIRRTTEARILAVPVQRSSAANCSKVNGAGGRRRLQALAVAGWPVATLAARLSVQENTVHRVLCQEGGLVSRRTLARICDLFSEVWNRRPEDCGVPPVSAKRARGLAARHGWHPVGVWDDIDDPSEVPQYGARVSRVDAVVEDATELIAEGYSREAIAERLGITWDAVRQAYIRKGAPLPELAE